MYLSNGRLPSLEAYPVITRLSPSYIEVQHFIKPDKFKFIKKDEYYTEMKAVLFDGNFNVMRTEDSDFINIENSFSSALHPSNKDYLINTHTIYRIQDENLPEDKSDIFSLVPRIEIPTFEYDMDNSQTKLREKPFNAIYGIYIQTSIACEGMPLKTDHALFYLTKAWHQKSTTLDDSVEFVGWGEQKGVRILMPSDVNRMKVPLNGIDTCIDKIVSGDE